MAVLWNRKKYRLKELGKLANIKLQTVLTSEKYKQCWFTHGLYGQETRDITFSLFVDNFGVRYREKKRHISSYQNATTEISN